MPTAPDPRSPADTGGRAARAAGRHARPGRRPAVNWADVAQAFPPGGVYPAVVLRLVKYGAFCALGDGVESLLHVSQLAWGRRPKHPSEVLAEGQAIDVKVRSVDVERGRMDLSLRETLPHPWDGVAERFPPGTVVRGTVARVVSYGVVVRVADALPDGAGGREIRGLVHLDDFSWTRKLSRGMAGTVLREGDAVTARVLRVDERAFRMALGIKQTVEDPWAAAIPARYAPGMRLRGRVTKLAKYGAFVEVAPELEGLLHASEIADASGEGADVDPAQFLTAGQEVEVVVLRVDAEQRRIGLSLRRAGAPAAAQTPRTEAA